MAPATHLRQLGKNGPMIPALGFGLMGLSHQVYGELPSDEERFKLLDRAYELGATNWDSADLYGDSEVLIGKWFKKTGKRSEIFLASKFGFVKGSTTYEIDSSGEYCKKACEESLKLLDTEYIDLYYMHHANPKTPIEDTMRALAELKAEGKIKYIGLSAISSRTLLRALKIAHVDAVQSDYSVFERQIEGPAGTDLLAVCRAHGVALVAAMPLNRGVLTSNFAAGEFGQGDMRGKVMPRFLPENRSKNEKIVRDFEKIAEKKGCSVAQLSLAWLLAQGDDIIPIPGTKKIKYLEENWASLDIKLTSEELKEIRDFREGVEVAGTALPAAFASYDFRDTVEEEA